MEKFITDLISKHIDDTSSAINGIDITVCLIAIIIQCAIATFTFSKMCNSSAEPSDSVDWKLKVLFSGAFLCVLVATLSDLVGNIVQEFGYQYPFVCYYIFFVGPK